MTSLNKNEINLLIDLAKEAGKIAMSHFGSKNLQINRKSDDSPVTNADIEISKFIERNLKKNFPEIDIICEEGQNRKISNNKFWLIDPIDGTKSFARTDPEFTVNIGLVEGNKPIFGIIFAPALPEAPLYYNNENGKTVRLLTGTNHHEILTKKPRNDEQFIIISGSEHNSAELISYIKNNLKSEQNLKIDKVSSSLKFCYIIENKADLYLHFRRSMEWDTAAGQALILGCGGVVMDIDYKKELEYRKENFINHSFLAKI